MNQITNDPIPANIPTVLVDDEKEALCEDTFGGYAFLIDPQDAHCYVVSEGRVKAVPVFPTTVLINVREG
jgi:hypothetical protein